MKVLHILNELRPSGAEVMLRLAAPYWKEQGLDLHVLSTGQRAGSFAEALTEAGFTVHHLPFASSPHFYLQFIRLIRTYRFDVVHLHTEHATLTYAVLARLAGTKRILRTIHSNFLFRGITRSTRALRRFLVRQLGVIQISVSKAVQQNEAKRFKNPTLLIYNWYDDSWFVPPTPEQKQAARAAIGLDDSEKCLVSVGNCAPHKNHSIILQAMRLLREEGLLVKYLHIGEEDWHKTERKLASQLGVDQQVCFLGYQRDVRPYLWAADVFVMPSSYEGFGIALLEAMACGLCIVLANSPGLSEWAELFPEIIYTEVDPSSLSQAIKKALHISRHGCMLSKKVADTFSVKCGARAYADLYNRGT